MRYFHVCLWCLQVESKILNDDFNFRDLHCTFEINATWSFYPAAVSTFIYLLNLHSSIYLFQLFQGFVLAALINCISFSPPFLSVSHYDFGYFIRVLLPSIFQVQKRIGVSHLVGNPFRNGRGSNFKISCRLHLNLFIYSYAWLHHAPPPLHTHTHTHCLYVQWERQMYTHTNLFSLMHTSVHKSTYMHKYKVINIHI